LSFSLKAAGLAGLLLVAWVSHAAAQDHPWLDPKLLEAAKAEGGELTVYSDTNEGEGLPLFKLFEAATGIRTNYVRGNDPALMARMVVEFRGNQKAWDVAQLGTMDKIPAQLLQQFDPPEAKNISPEARDKDRRWYGLYANYNAPGYNTQHVNAADLPATFADFVKHKDWAGHVAIDSTDSEWLYAMYQYYGDDKATALVKDIVAAIQPIVTDGHLALARSIGSGEYWVALNNFVNLTMNVKLAGGPTDYFPLDPVALTFGAVGISAKPAHPNTALLAANFLLSKEAQTFLAKFGRIPTRDDVESNPPGIIAAINKKKVITVLLDADEERKWQKKFNELFKGK
jgi:iron(III) transport system substrate-binding protein